MIASPTESFLDEQKALACIHCGLCLGSCPTYLETGNENDSPRGRIYLMRALEQQRLPLDANSIRHIDLCLGCRACEAACPSGVAYGGLLETTREHIEQCYSRPLFQRWLRRYAIEKVFPFPRRLKWALRPAQLALRMGLARFLPRFFREALSLVPERFSERALPQFSPATIEEKRGTVGFMPGCVMSVLFGETNYSTVRVLNAAGFNVDIPPGQGCCGALYAHSGNLELARQCARVNIAAFEARELDAIVINAAGCGSTLKEYGHLLAEDPEWAERAARFSGRVRDFTEWLAGCGKVFSPSCQAACGVTFHDACHLAHPQRITKEPRTLVRAVAGTNFVELAEADVCCGSAGSYNLTEPEMAQRLQARKVQNILRTGAKVVVTTNPGCILQIRAGLKKAGADQVKVAHIADFLAESLGAP